MVFDYKKMGHILPTLLRKYGSLYLKACSDDAACAGVLYALCCRSFPTEWVPVYTHHPPFFEYERLLEEEVGKKAILASLATLHTRGFIYRAWYDKHANTFVIDEGVDEKTVPHATRDVMRRNAFPLYFVQVRHMAIVEKVMPHLMITISVALKRIQQEYHYAPQDVPTLAPQTQDWYYHMVLGDVQAQMTRWENEALYISASIQAAILRFLRDHVATC